MSRTDATPRTAGSSRPLPVLLWLLLMLLLSAAAPPEASAAPASAATNRASCDDFAARAEPVAAADCLSKYGITIEAVTPSTRVVVIDQHALYEGQAAAAASAPNVITQVGSNDPVSFTLRFKSPVQSVGFARAKLIAGPSGIVHPAWSAEARNASGAVVANVRESQLASYADVAAQTYRLTGSAITHLVISSDNGHRAAFSALLFDDLEWVDAKAEAAPVAAPARTETPAEHPAARPAEHPAERPIAAVFDIDLQGLEMKPAVRERLTAYVATLLAARGFQLVPRAQLKERLSTEKRDSYRACFDESCQIEIGRELAAQKTIATQVLRLGKKCKVAVTLFDLRRAASEGAAAVSGACDEDAVVSSLEKAVDELVRARAK